MSRREQVQGAHQVRTAARWSIVLMAAACSAYAAYVAATWVRYGEPPSPAADETDPLLDRFMPRYEVVDRHHIRIDAPAATVLSAAREMDLLRSPIVRAIFKGREVILGATPDNRGQERGVLAEMQSLGWRVLAEVPDREIVVGAVTRPWEPNVTFRPIEPEAFAAFAEPGYVKILWTLRADPVTDQVSVFRTETRVTTTDAEARARFRRYWACFSPGIKTIRWMLLAPLKAEAERRVRA